MVNSTFKPKGNSGVSCSLGYSGIPFSCAKRTLWTYFLATASMNKNFVFVSEVHVLLVAFRVFVVNQSGVIQWITAGAFRL